MNRHVVLGGSGVTNQHVVVGDRSVTFRHKRNKENESCIMEIYSSLKNLFPKWVWCGGLSPQVWSWYRWLNTCLLYCYWHLFILFVAYHMLSARVDFILLLNVYCFLFWVGWWYLLSTCSLYWPLLVFSSLCYLWSTANVPSTSTHPQL